MGARITQGQRETFYRFLGEGHNVKTAAQLAAVSYSWAKNNLANLPSKGAALKEAKKAASLHGPIPFEKLKPEAKRALDDFEYFRRRYFGHVSLPWHVSAATSVVEMLSSPHKEYTVMSVGPGSGKTTLVHDIACWVVVRRRDVRILMGSATSKKAETMQKRVRRSLERVTPTRASAEDKERGLACDSEATLCVDFGLFKPATGGDLWRADSFIVLQHGDEMIDEKEPTCSAYGMDQDFLGGRYDLIFWDDLVTMKHVKTMEQVEQQREWWDREAESRLEPGGALFLVGQRVASNDLYRHCLDKKLLPEDDDDFEQAAKALTAGESEKVADLPTKYTHVVYRAHDEIRCQGEHKVDAPAWPDGCLLDPRRLTWRELRAIRANDAAVYATWYQQEDADPLRTLVKSVWVTGGTDPETGTYHPGCWDKDRDLWEIPKGLVGPKYFFGTVDPSPSKMWAIQAWCVAEGQLVTTERGEVPIQQVQLSDKVLTRSGFCHIQHVTHMGVKPVLNISMSNGRTLRVTADHKVLLADGRWVEAGSLLVGSALCAASPLGSVPADTTDNAGLTANRHRVPAGHRVAVDALGSSVSDVRGADHVRPVVDEFQMVGVDTRRIATEVVEFPDWERLAAITQNSISKSVREAFPMRESADLPVAELALGVNDLLSRSLPLPASGGRDYDAFKKPRLVHPNPASFVQHPVATHVAHASLRADGGTASTSVHVESIHHGPPTDVFDLGVYGPHEFVAEGVVVHNCYAPEAGHQLFLLDTIRRSMGGNELLDWNNNTQSWYGVMEEWQTRSEANDMKFVAWVVEVNAAQRFLLQFDHVRRWIGARQVDVRPHTTTVRKNDADLGVDMCRDWWKFGRIRLPGKATTQARTASLKLVEEVQKYPNAYTDDQVLAHYFAILHLPEISSGWEIKEPPKFARPTWLQGSDRGFVRV